VFKLDLAFGDCILLNSITRAKAQYVSLIGLIACLIYFGQNTWSTRILAAQEANTPTSLTQLLFRAIKSNDIEKVRTLIGAGADLSSINLNGQTAIDVAIRHNYFKIAEYLVFARRVEQKSVLRLIPTTNSIGQDSAKVVPDISYSYPKKLAQKKEKSIQTFSAKTKQKQFKTPQQATLKQTTKTQNNLLTAPTAIVDKTGGTVPPAQSIFIIGMDGKLFPASAEDIERIKKNVSLNTSRSMSDIEPRKPFFIPKPRSKPNYRLSPPNASKLERFKIQSTNTVNKPSSQKKPTSAPQNEFARPTRRISPQLLKKLRESLENSKNQNQIKKKMHEKDNNNLQESKLTAPALLRNVEPIASSGIVADQSKAIKALPRIVNKTSPEINKVKQESSFSKIISKISSLIGITTDTKEIKKEIEIAESKAEIRTKPKNTQLPRKESSKKNYRGPSSTNHSNITNDSRPNITVRGNTTPNIMQPDRKMTKVRNSLLRLPKLSKSDSLNENRERKNSPKLDTINSPLHNKNVLKIPLTQLRKPLKNKLLTLGNSIATGQTKLPRGIAEPDSCIRKRRGKISFCIVPVDWPHTLENIFSVNTSLYQGTRAIARYDGDKASHFHALYRSKNHAKILEFFKKRYGKPTDVWRRIIAPFGKPRQPNPTFVWRSLDTELNKVTVLEMRKFDDTRTVFPDTEHGAIRLYTAGGPPVFPIITAHDIMSIDWVARSDHLDSASPTLARTIRVQ